MSDFWTSPTFEPKRAFRFLVEFTPGESESLQFLAKSVDRPSYTVSSNPHKFFNHTFYYPGRVEWNTVSLTLVDALKPNAAEIFMTYLNDIGYADPEGEATSALSSHNIINHAITKNTATRQLGMVKIMEIGTNQDPSAGDTTAEVKAEWVLRNAFITEVNFGSHAYDSEEMIDIQLTIQYDWANYNILQTR
tara:strand:+ start:33 stop:608 length:576 start_codon:yes stop_codon:yes gene_type:complete